MSSTEKDTAVAILESYMANNNLTIEMIDREKLPDEIKHIYDALTAR